jgi:hypothetical protein
VRFRPVAALSITLLLPVGSLPQGSSQGPPPTDTASVTVTVEATHPWMDSGLTVRKGERLTFHAEGTIRWGSEPDQVAGPEGHDRRAGKLGAGGLIGRVGSTGKPFPVGNTRTPIVMSKSGKLFLGINDFIFNDNTGSFTVTISRSEAP